MSGPDYRAYGIITGNSITANSDITHVSGDVAKYGLLLGTGKLAVEGHQSKAIGSLNGINDALANYASYMAMTPNFTFPNANIGGMTFTPGIIQLTNAGITVGGALPNNAITLSGRGQYVFQIPNGGLITDPTLNPVFFQLADDSQAADIIWLVNGDVHLQTIGANSTAWQGSIICQDTITLDSGVTSMGTLAAPNPGGAVSVTDNIIQSNLIVFAGQIDNSGYAILQSSLSDNRAVKIIASDPNGGIEMDSGFGGISITTTNSINMTSTNASSFTVTGPGNLVLQALAGLLNIDAASGLNIGNAATTTPILIGSSANPKTIVIGNQNTTSTTNIYSGSGGLTIDAIGGQLVMDSNISTNIGTGLPNQVINIGNSVGTTAVNIDSGTYGLTIGNNSANGGPIQIGNTTVGKDIMIGNVNAGSDLRLRWGNNGGFKTEHQEPETNLADANTTLTFDNNPSSGLLNVILSGSPTQSNNWSLTLPTSDAVIAAVAGLANLDSFDFVVINNSPPASNLVLTLIASTGVTTVGKMMIDPAVNFSPGSGIFRIRFTSIVSPTAYTIYRLA
jgi:hypothetical protein